MARDDGFRRYLELGTALLDMTQQRAEALVKDLVKAGDVSKGKAEKAINDLLERSRKTTDELRAIVRREVAEQVQALGLATKDDIARLEAKLAATGTASEPADAAARPVRKGAPITKAATTDPNRTTAAKPKPPAPKASAPKASTPGKAPPKPAKASSKPAKKSPGPVPADSPDLRPSSGTRAEDGA